MGLPICRRLAAAGWAVTATDLRRQREADVRAAGADWAPDAAGLVDAVDVVLTVLPGQAEVESAMAVALARLRSGTAWIDMTSGDPRAARALVAAATVHGVETLDAGMGGGIPAVQDGTLQLFVGGEAAAVERHRPLLEVLGRVEHVGGPGAGRLVKLVVNLLWFGQAVALSEALLLARRSGLDLDVVAGALGRSSAASEFVAGDLPGLLAGDYRDSFGLDRCCDEIDALAGLACELGVPFELSETVRRAYRAALERYGPVDGELRAVALLEERAGIALRGGA
jgi:3-hydroxyisobutyrate dehydrogenase-like beta-hydroxyacid dehydrogenase